MAVLAFKRQHGLAPTSVWRITNYVDQQTLKPDDDYVLPHQCRWTFDVLVWPLSATERFLLQPLVCGTVFHRTSLLRQHIYYSPPWTFCSRFKSHLVSLSYPASWQCPRRDSWFWTPQSFLHLTFNIYEVVIQCGKRGNKKWKRWAEFFSNDHKYVFQTSTNVLFISNCSAYNEPMTSHALGGLAGRRRTRKQAQRA